MTLAAESNVPARGLRITSGGISLLRIRSAVQLARPSADSVEVVVSSSALAVGSTTIAPLAEETPVATVVMPVPPAFPSTEAVAEAVNEPGDVVLSCGAWSAAKGKNDQPRKATLVWSLTAEASRKTPEFAQVCSAEAQRLAVIRHPALLQVKDVTVDDGIPTLTTERRQGLLLSEHVASRQPLSLPRALNLIQQIAEGLNRALQAHLIHRSISPSLIWVTRDAEKAALGGLAWPTWMLELEETQLTDVSGPSWLYWAPERIVDPATATHRSDIYSLGAILHYAITGKPPLSAATPGDLVRQQKDGAALVELSQSPGTVVSLVRWLLTPEPSLRPHSYSMVLPLLHAATISERSRGVRRKMEATLNRS